MIVKISPKLSEARDLAQTYRQTVPHEALQQQSFYHQINMDVISISVHAEQQFQLSLLRFRESGEVAKYSNERISVCLSVCLSISISRTTHAIFTKIVVNVACGRSRIRTIT